MRMQSTTSKLCGMSIALLVGCSVAGKETDGFPEGLKQALLSGGTFKFEEHSPKIEFACLVHQYNNSRSVAEAFGIEGAPLLNVGEMENLVLLKMLDGTFEYFGVRLDYYLKTPDLPFFKCFDAKELVWTFNGLASDNAASAILTVSGDLLQRINI